MTVKIPLLAAVCLAGFLAGCGTPPGKGRKAAVGYRAAAPVIAALEKFHADRGQYPESLGELVPTYLLDLRALLYRGRTQPVNAPGHDESIPEHEFGYRRDGNTYTLMFSYTGPGMNHCVYDSETKAWHARGYY
jgi:hypothetical protein